MTEASTPSTQNNPMALTSVIAAAVGWVLGGLTSCAGFLFPPILACSAIVFLLGNAVAAVTGYMGRQQISESGGAQGGQGMATAGLALGAVGVVLGILLICIVIALVFLAGPAIQSIFDNIVSDLQ